MANSRDSCKPMWEGDSQHPPSDAICYTLNAEANTINYKTWNDLEDEAYKQNLLHAGMYGKHVCFMLHLKDKDNAAAT